MIERTKQKLNSKTNRNETAFFFSFFFFKCFCLDLLLSFTWQDEQDKDTRLSSSVRISSFSVFSWFPPFPPPRATPSSSLPPPFTRWLLMVSRVWSWTYQHPDIHINEYMVCPYIKLYFNGMAGNLTCVLLYRWSSLLWMVLMVSFMCGWAESAGTIAPFRSGLYTERVKMISTNSLHYPGMCVCVCGGRENSKERFSLNLANSTQ